MRRFSTFVTPFSLALLLAGPGMADPLCAGIDKVLAAMPADYASLCNCSAGVPVQVAVPARYKLPGAVPIRYYDGSRDVACGIARIFIPVDDPTNSVTHSGAAQDAPGYYSCHFPAGTNAVAGANALTGRVAACLGIATPQPVAADSDSIRYEFVARGADFRIHGDVENGGGRSSFDVELQIVRDDPRLHQQ